MAGKKKYKKEDTKEGRQRKEGYDNGKEEIERNNRWECLSEENMREEEEKVREKGITEERQLKEKMGNKPEEGYEGDAMRKDKEVGKNRNAIQRETQNEWERNEYKVINRNKKRKEPNEGNEGENSKKAKSRDKDVNTKGEEETRAGDEDNWVSKRTNQHDQETGVKNTCDQYDWDSQHDEYMITVVINKDKIKTSKKLTSLRYTKS